MADSEVGNAFVTIGGKTEALKKAFSDSESLTRKTLGSMGREIGGFATRFGGKLGLGLGGGFAAAAASIVKTGVTISGSLANVAQRAGELGVSFDDQLAIIDKFLASSKKLIPLTREQSLAMGALGLQYGFSGKKLQEFMRDSRGLASGFGQPIEAMQAMIDVLTKGGDLLKFGVKVTGTTEQVFGGARLVGRRRAEAEERRGGLRPGTLIESLFAGLERTKAELSEGFQRAFDPPPLTAAEQRQRAADRKREIPIKLPGAAGLFPGGTFGFLPPSPGGERATQPPRAAERFRREADFFNDRTTGETGVGAAERALRGTTAGGGGGTESEKLSSALEKLKGAVDSNTAAVKGLTSGRPLVAEHP